MDKNCMSYWFPKIRDAGLPVPHTEFVMLDRNGLTGICDLLDGKSCAGPGAAPFILNLSRTATAIGFPCFLRSGQTSAKHDWKESCYVPSADGIETHVAQIINYGECCGCPGWPWDVWAVREYLPIKPVSVCPSYSDMPVCREFRFFVRGGEIICHHPYWPDKALEQGGADVGCSHALDATSSEIQEMSVIASKAGYAVGGEWSIDILETKRGWYLTDMAEANRSYHWEGCANA